MNSEHNMKIKICLVILFNHRFDNNIPILRKIYADKFNTIRFLVPFYDGNDKDVIPVYECSYQFQGFLIQAYEKLVQTQSDYYFFIADDMVLHPDIDQSNVLERINMVDKDVFISEMYLINSANRFNWIHSRYSSKPFLHKSTSWKGNIPDRCVALDTFRDFWDYEYPERYLDDFWGNQPEEEKARFVKDNGGDITIPYPMAGGYSDIFILSKYVLFPISRTCGVFSAMNLFVEIAFPTSIVLNVARDKVVTIDMTRYKAGAYWEDNIRLFEEKYSLNLEKLLDEWDNTKLFVHPVKLSKWDVSGLMDE